jgi:serine/threonine protein kinase
VEINEDDKKSKHKEKRPFSQSDCSVSSRSESSHDDTADHYKGDPGAMIGHGQQYQVVKEVGMGTFGRVLDCLDLKRREYVAVKAVRAVKRYYESAIIEARIVQDINRRGGRGLTHCVRLFDSFTFRGHYCIVFESLGPSLYDFLKRHDYKPFPMIFVQDFTVQLLETLEFIHSFQMIHTDLKVAIKWSRSQELSLISLTQHFFVRKIAA